MNPRLPTLFLGHGSPMNALSRNAYMQAFHDLGRKLLNSDVPVRAVLSVSAHWFTHGSHVTAMPKPRTIHDFSGFPQALFDMQYPAPGSPDLAARVRALLPEAANDFSWGLDHGTWSVLCHLFPEANIPVVQLSIDANLSVRAHFDQAKRLRPLRSEGVLIIGSGNIVHNLREIDRHALNDTNGAYPWAQSTQTLVNKWLHQGDTDALTDEARYPEHLFRSVPTPEHFLPLIYTAGAATGSDGRLESVEIFNDDIVGKSLSMTSVIFGG